MRTIVSASAGLALVIGAVAAAQPPRERAASFRPPEAVRPSDAAPNAPVARGAAEERTTSTPVSKAAPRGPAWLNDPGVVPAAGTSGRPEGVRPLTGAPKDDAPRPGEKFGDRFKLPSPPPAPQPADQPTAASPFRGTAANGAPVYAGPPAYRWYGWGSVTPGANPLAPTGQYPKASANWYSITGATPGAFPVPVVNPLRSPPGTEPPAYAAARPVATAPVVTTSGSPQSVFQPPAPQIPPPQSLEPPRFAPPPSAESKFGASPDVFAPPGAQAGVVPPPGPQPGIAPLIPPPKVTPPPTTPSPLVAAPVIPPPAPYDPQVAASRPRIDGGLVPPPPFPEVKAGPTEPAPLPLPGPRAGSLAAVPPPELPPLPAISAGVAPPPLVPAPAPILPPEPPKAVAAEPPSVPPAPSAAKPDEPVRVELPPKPAEPAREPLRWQSAPEPTQTAPGTWAPVGGAAPTAPTAPQPPPVNEAPTWKSGMAPGKPVARAQMENSDASPIEAVIRQVCQGRASGVEVRWTGTKKLTVCFETRTADDARRLVTELSKRPELGPYHIDFCAVVK